MDLPRRGTGRSVGDVSDRHCTESVVVGRPNAFSILTASKMGHLTSYLILPLALGTALIACTHTPPGTSVEIALAKRAELVRLPATPTPVPVHTVAAPNVASTGPAPTEKTEQVADAYARGEFCMKAGKDAEAISAFQEVVKLDPKFFQAWDSLATLYERAGNEKEAMSAFKRAKLARQ